MFILQEALPIRTGKVEMRMGPEKDLARRTLVVAHSAAALGIQVVAHSAAALESGPH